MPVKYYINLFIPPHRLKGQIPEIKQTLEILKYMQKKKVSVFLFASISGSEFFDRDLIPLTPWYWYFIYAVGFTFTFLLMLPTVTLKTVYLRQKDGFVAFP